jgi:hypothetical protein
MANSVIHGVALLATIVAVPFLIVQATHLGIAYLVGVSVFSATMALLYLTATPCYPKMDSTADSAGLFLSVGQARSHAPWDHQRYLWPLPGGGIQGKKIHPEDLFVCTR